MTPQSAPSVPRRLRFALRFSDGKAFLVARQVPLSGPDLPAGAQVEELVLEVPHARFPMDVSGGADRFQSWRLAARRVEVTLRPAFLQDLLQARLALRGWRDVGVRLLDGELEVEACVPDEGHPAGTVAVVRLGVVPAPPGAVELVVTRAVVVGVGRVTALEVVEGVLAAVGASPSRTSPLVARLDPARLVVRALLNRHGWKTPALDGLTDVELTLDAGRLHGVATAEPLVLGAGLPGPLRESSVMAVSPLLASWREVRGNAAAVERLLEAARRHPLALALAADLAPAEGPARATAVALLADALVHAPADLDLNVAAARLAQTEAAAWHRVVALARERGDAAVLQAAAATWADVVPGDPSSALLDAHRAAVAARPERGLVALGLARVAARAAQWAECARAADRALELGVSSVDAREAARWLATACRAQADTHGERQAWLRALSHGEDTQALSGLADLLAREGQPTEAVRFLLRAAQAASSDAERAEVMARAARLTSEATGDAGGALLLWQQVMALDSRPAFRAPAAQAAWDAGDLELVEQWARDPGGALPEEPARARLLALALWQRGGRDEDALAMLHRAATVPALKDASWSQADSEVRSRLADLSRNSVLERTQPSLPPVHALQAGSAEDVAHQALQDALRSRTAAQVDHAVQTLGGLQGTARAALARAAWDMDAGKSVTALPPDVALRLARAWWNVDPAAALPLVRNLAASMDAADWRNLADAARGLGVPAAELEGLEALQRSGVDLAREERTRLADLLVADGRSDQAAAVRGAESPEARLRTLVDQAVQAAGTAGEIAQLTELVEQSRREPGAAALAGVDRHRAVLRLADCYEEQGHFEEAVRVLTSAETLDAPAGDRSKLFRRLAGLEERLGRPERARAALERVLRSTPDDDEVVRALVRLLESREWFRDLAELHRSRAARTEGPAKVAHLMAEGDLWARRLGEPREAIRCFRHALRLAPQSDAPLRHLVNLQRRGRPAALVRSYLMAARLRANPSTAGLLENAAEILVGLSLRPRLAAVVYRAAVTRHPGLLSAWRALAETQLNLLEPEQAQETLRVLVHGTEDPRARASARAWRAEILSRNLGRHQEALEEVQAARRDNPELTGPLPLHQELAVRLELPAEVDRVVQARVRLLDAPEDRARLAVEGARQLMQLGDPAGAARWAEAALEAAPEDLGAWTVLKDSAVLLEDLPLQARALRKLLDMAAAADPADDAERAALARQLSRVQARTGDLSAAAQTLQQAWETSPASAEERGQVLGWYLAAGAVEHAVMALQEGWCAGAEVPPEAAAAVVVAAAQQAPTLVDTLLSQAPGPLLSALAGRVTPTDGLRRVLAAAAARQDDLEQAGRWLGELDQPTDDDLRRRWRWLAELERWEDVLAVVVALLARAPADVALLEAAVELARDRLEAPARAVAFCRRWVELRPEARGARAALVELLEETGSLAAAAVEVSAWARQRAGLEATALWRKALELAAAAGDPAVLLDVASQAHAVVPDAETLRVLNQARAAAANQPVQAPAPDPYGDAVRAGDEAAQRAALQDAARTTEDDLALAALLARAGRWEQALAQAQEAGQRGCAPDALDWFRVDVAQLQQDAPARLAALRSLAERGSAAAAEALHQADPLDRLRQRAAQASAADAPEAAARAWTALAEAGDARAWSPAALWLERLGHFAEAAVAWERAVPAAQGLDARKELLTRAAVAWDAAGDSEASERVRVALVEADPADRAGFEALERRMRRAGNLDGLPELTVKVAHAQADPAARLELLERAGLLLRETQGQAAAAMDVFAQVLAEDGRRWRSAVALADLALQRGQLALAARWLDAIPADADPATTGIPAAELAARQQACRQALQAGSAPAEAPDAPGAGDADRAPPVDQEPERHVAWVLERAARLQAAGQRDTAAQLLDDAVRRVPDSLELALALARARRETQPERAALTFHAISLMVDSGPERTPVLLEEAEAWLAAGRVQEAAQAAALAWKHQPADPALFCRALELAANALDQELLLRLGRVLHTLADPPSLSPQLHRVLAQALAGDDAVDAAALMEHVRQALRAEDGWTLRVLAVDAARRLQDGPALVEHVLAALPHAPDPAAAAALALQAARSAWTPGADPAHARELVQRALAVAPGHPEALQLLQALDAPAPEDNLMDELARAAVQAQARGQSRRAALCGTAHRWLGGRVDVPVSLVPAVDGTPPRPLDLALDGAWLAPPGFCVPLARLFSTMGSAIHAVLPRPELSIRPLTAEEARALAPEARSVRGLVGGLLPLVTGEGAGVHVTGRVTPQLALDPAALRADPVTRRTVLALGSAVSLWGLEPALVLEAPRLVELRDAVAALVDGGGVPADPAVAALVERLEKAQRVRTLESARAALYDLRAAGSVDVPAWQEHCRTVVRRLAWLVAGELEPARAALRSFPVLAGLAEPGAPAGAAWLRWVALGEGLAARERLGLELPARELAPG